MKYTSSLIPTKFLSKSEEGDLRVILEKYRDEDLRYTTMLLFMLSTGARPSEVVNLLWRDINVSDKSVFIKTLKHGDDRCVPLTKNLLQRFRALGRGNEEDKIFPIGYPMFQNRWYKYRPCKKPLHCLRHTFAVNFYKRSRNDLWLTQKVLGHKRLDTTSVYLAVTATLEQLRKAMGV